MKRNNKRLSFLLALLLVLSSLWGCDTQTSPHDTTSTTLTEINTTESDTSEESTTAASTSLEEDATTDEPEETTAEPSKPSGSVTILNGSELTMTEGEALRLMISKSSSIYQEITWTVEGNAVTVDHTGMLTAKEAGDATVTATAGDATDSILIHVVKSTIIVPGDLEHRPQEEIQEAVHSPAGYRPAASHEEALERSGRGELSGYDFVPDQAPLISEYRPMQDGKYLKNTASYYADKNTYVVVDAYAREVFRVYRGGAYITLEEVAAYIYAFGTVPANHTSSKSTKPSANAFGIYLRVNNTKFSGNTANYPYEPELPRISGCGGDLIYWEMDIGTTGTDCDPKYPAKLYNNGKSITRGAARIVYTWNDLNSNGMTDATDVVYVFYTYNHYNDFQEYLNYYGGWGEMFGNITGGGKISSTTDYNPTDYVPVATGSIFEIPMKQVSIAIAWILPSQKYYTVYTV